MYDHQHAPLALEFSQCKKPNHTNIDNLTQAPSIYTEVKIEISGSVPTLSSGQMVSDLPVAFVDKSIAFLIDFQELVVQNGSAM